MKLTSFAVLGALLLGLSFPAFAARSTGDQAPSEQLSKFGDTQVAGLVMSEYDYE